MINEEKIRAKILEILKDHDNFREVLPNGFVDEIIAEIKANPIEPQVILKIVEDEDKIIKEFSEKYPKISIIIDVVRPVGEGYTLEKYCTYKITDGFNKILLTSEEIKAEDCIKKVKLKAISNFSAQQLS